MIQGKNQGNFFKIFSLFRSNPDVRVRDILSANVSHNKKIRLDTSAQSGVLYVVPAVVPEPKAPKKGLFLPLLKVYTGSFVNAVKGFPAPNKDPDVDKHQVRSIK